MTALDPTPEDIKAFKAEYAKYFDTKIISTVTSSSQWGLPQITLKPPKMQYVPEKGTIVAKTTESKHWHKAKKLATEVEVGEFLELGVGSPLPILEIAPHKSYPKEYLSFKLDTTGFEHTVNKNYDALIGGTVWISARCPERAQIDEIADELAMVVARLPHPQRHVVADEMTAWLESRTELSDDEARQFNEKARYFEMPQLNGFLLPGPDPIPEAEIEALEALSVAPGERVVYIAYCDTCDTSEEVTDQGLVLVDALDTSFADHEAPVPDVALGA